MKNKQSKKTTKTKTINTISIQRRIYPELIDLIVRTAQLTPGTTPTKVAANLLSKQLCLPDPVRKNAAKPKE